MNGGPSGASGPKAEVRVIAFYLPQFHPTPENDLWWGRGFTEWTNVVKAHPLFPGHYQPHLPADLGFYDLRLPEARAAQAELGDRYGLAAFCYYHYWFHGKRVLGRPFDEVLKSGTPRLPFCLCWANENWTRRWDGRSGEILMQQEYSTADEDAHIEYLLSAFADERYVRIGGCPLFLIWRAELLPDARRMTDSWRERARTAGFPGLYLVAVESHKGVADPRKLGFDATVEFAPDWRVLPRLSPLHPNNCLKGRLRDLLGRRARKRREFEIYGYQDLVDVMLAKADVAHRHFRCITPGWDNSPRWGRRAVVFHGSTPEAYGRWLRQVIEATCLENEGDERIVFVNAWNEWAEGAHLEPDQRWGVRYLEETKLARDPSSRS
jgi:lipopolysaccharide biosynthesis protein